MVLTRRGSWSVAQPATCMRTAPLCCPPAALSCAHTCRTMRRRGQAMEDAWMCSLHVGRCTKSAEFRKPVSGHRRCRGCCQSGERFPWVDSALALALPGRGRPSLLPLSALMPSVAHLYVLMHSPLYPWGGKRRAAATAAAPGAVARFRTSQRCSRRRNKHRQERSPLDVVITGVSGRHSSPAPCAS